MYQSETSKHRERLLPYCQGSGIDIGFGGDPITPEAIRVDLEVPYVHTGNYRVQLGGDCRNLVWFADGVLDYVYSSHVLEDFTVDETVPIMREWSRVLKEGGHLVLLQPDQQRYVVHCEKTGQPRNPAHAVDHFSLSYVIEAAKQVGNLEVKASADHIDEYSFFVVFSKTGGGGSANDTATEVQRLRRELARTESAFQQSQYHLGRYIQNPLVRLLRGPYRFFKKLFNRT